MQERQLTIDGVTLPSPRPSLVLATQNPIELEGTFPLPEAQIDRFLLRVSIGYPSQVEENQILERFGVEDPLPELKPVTTPEEIIELATKFTPYGVVGDCLRVDYHRVVADRFEIAYSQQKGYFCR